MGKEVDIRVEVDGVEPEQVDAQRFFDVASATLAALNHLSRTQRGEILTFKGVQVVNKCVAAVTRPSNPTLAMLLSEHVSALVHEDVHAPREIFSQVRRLQNTVSSLRPNETLSIVSGDRKVPIRVREQFKAQPGFGTTAFRGELIRVGGRRPKARFRELLTAEIIELGCKKATAVELAKNLYATFDIEAQVAWKDDGQIKDGQVLDFTRVDVETDPVAALDEWYTEIGRPWADVVDPLAELRHED